MEMLGPTALIEQDLIFARLIFGTLDELNHKLTGWEIIHQLSLPGCSQSLAEELQLRFGSL